MPLPAHCVPIADSSDAITFCAEVALTDMDLEVPLPARTRESIELTLANSFVFLTGIGDAALATTYAARFVAHGNHVMVKMTCFYPEAISLQFTLSAQAISVAIVSTNFRHRIEQILQHANLAYYVTVVVGNEDVTHHKPHPEGVHKALALLGVVPEESAARRRRGGDGRGSRQSGRGGVADRIQVEGPTSVIGSSD